MKKITFVLLTSILLLAACGSKISKDQQERLEVITEKVDSVTGAINKIDSLALEQMLFDFFEKKNFLQNDLKDTIPYRLIFKLDSFVQMRKEMGFIRNEYSMIKSEANLMNSQIKDLNHDINNGLVEENQFERYYELEKKNSDQLQAVSKKLLFKVKRMQTEYPKFIPFVDSIINSYKSEMNE
ncbi:MAG: hypothetical protein JKY48_10485 [Flavobacteriales bacterium]|nr:hypothetical protein [Flavobacteriales bacterium]